MLKFNPLNPLAGEKGWEVNQRDHRKRLIVDGRTAFLGGINIGAVYAGGSSSKVLDAQPDSKLAWRDSDLQLDGPVVAEDQKLFLATWGAGGPPVAGEGLLSETQEGGSGSRAGDQ